MKEERQIFVLRIQPLHRTDATKALRFLLKGLLRKYGLKCLSIKPETEPEIGENPNDHIHRRNTEETT